MAWIYYEALITDGLRRAEKQKRTVDTVDKFIGLWIAFNGWMKIKHGEDTKEWLMIKQVKQLSEMEFIYATLEEENQ